MEIVQPAHLEGKTIKTARISEDNVEITFTDGSEIDIRLQFYGYGGCRLENSYYPNIAENI